mmetsp:Transcript_19033/g.39885  ORF Transcript_19033/g.39885 Transcript_19033/m.39885 type:complete len:88 (+) Transcript_19033:49-312(+)
MQWKKGTQQHVIHQGTLYKRHGRKHFISDTRWGTSSITAGKACRPRNPGRNIFNAKKRCVPVIFARCKKAIYGIVTAALLSHEKLLL